MKLQKTLPALVLTVAMMLSMVTPAWAAGNTRNAADSAVTGSVQATVRLDYAQTLEEIQERNIQVRLLKDNTSLGIVSLTTQGTVKFNDGEKEIIGTVSHRDAAGGERIGSADPKGLDLFITGLPQGNYTLRFIGEGYVDGNVPFVIDDYSKYVEVGTGDATFAIGDINDDNVVDERDRDALSDALGSTEASKIAEYDLNGDGKIDIMDLAYVNHNVNTPSIHATILDTVCFDVPLDKTESESALREAGTKVEGSLEDILQDNNSGVKFTSEGSTVNIPITLSNPVETQSIEIATPNGVGGIGGGTVTVIGENGEEEEADIPAVPEGVHAIGRAGESSRVIKITLKKRVAVKKITIEVTKTADNEFVTVETIQFLKDIVPENLVEPNSQVRNLYPTAGDAQVALTWNALPNVSGYRVDYWMKDQESNKRQLNVDVNEAIVTGLENGKKYFFTVTPTDGAWIGQTCESVSAEPLSTKAPPAPDMVNVTAQDSALDVSWKKGKEATKFKVYYTDMADTPIGDYKELDRVLTEPSVTISGLTNGTTYYIYVKAGNTSSNGEDRWSAPSRISTGIPKAVSYDKPEGIPTQGILPRDKIASVRLADQGNYHKPAYTTDAPFKADNVIDNDYRTHWTASTNWSRDEHIICTFTEPVDLSAAIWVPRLDGTYPTNLRAYSVRVWLDGDDLNGPGRLIVPDPQRGGTDAVGTWPNIPNRSMISTSRFAIMPFGPVENVRQISVAAEQRDYTVVSCSELMFVEYDPGHSLPDEIDALFAGGKDGLHTELASGVSEEKIKALETRLTSEERNYYWDTRTMDDELLMARELLTGGKKTNDMMLNGLQAPAGTESHGQGGSNLQPLGVTARAGQEITVYASGIPEGKSVPIYASQFNAEVSAWNAKIGDVKNGRNIFVVPKIGSQSTERGGSLYYTYNGSDADAAKIQLHVRRAVDIPVLQLADWYKIEDTTKRSRISAYLDELSTYVTAQQITSANATTRTTNVTEISTPSVLLSIPAATVMGKTETDLYNSILAWEDVMHICKTTQGIDKTYAQNDMPTRQNIRCMQMFAGAFMYAAGNHIGIGYGSCGGMVSGMPISTMTDNATANNLFGWGIAHEIGHNMDKLGKAEITNNIYSLMVQTYDGKNNTLPSRLEKSGKYPEIFNKVAQGYPGASNNVFVQLGMYWQLHLAYDGAKNVNGQDKDGPMQFYNRFFTEWKKGNSNTYLQGENITIADLSSDERFALTASGVAGRDLTEFFKRWGMTLSGPVETKLKAYGEETRAIWYLNDQSRRDIIAGKTTQTGTLNVTAEVQAGKDKEIKNNVVLTITTSGLNTDANNTISPVQGYEILRDGKSIAFTTDTTYTDIIGSANHRTYTYSVVAYDTCGNKLAEGSADEVRIAYDKLVPAEDYTVEIEGNTATVTFTKGATSVSGLKLTGTAWKAGGAYTVTVESPDPEVTGSIKSTVARTGDFQSGNQAVDDANSYLTYFQKPGVGPQDTRIWVYDATKITIEGIPSGVNANNIQLLSYAGDDISFLEGGTMGRLSANYTYTDNEGKEQVIEAGTLVIVGNYRGDPRFNTIQVQGRFTKTTANESDDPTVEERPVDGYVLLFAEIPDDGEVSDISDGLFIYVPNVQREAELQDKLDEEGNVLTHCSGVNLLPSQIRAVLYRTDDPNNADNKRTTAETLWINSPGGDDLPTIVLK